MIPRSLLVASRGDIAICVMRAAAELGIRTVAIFAEDDTRALHTRKADDARALSGTGAAAYLDGDQILAIAKDAGCDAIHPGCGFLSENAAFARRCHERGFIFVGPRPEIFELFGDKAWARSLAERCGVPVLTEMARTRTRRIEVQVIGDRAGNLSHLWERECSIQREGQQLIDIAPSPGLSADLRDGLIAAAMRIAGQARYDNLGTFAFMVEAAADSNATYAFIGAKPHLPVDHAVTEAVTDVDLVKLQLELAAGKSFADLGLCRADVPKPRGFAIAVRIGLEAIGAGDGATPAGNALTVFEAPSGPGLRVDSSAYMGYIVKAGFDSPLARLIAHSPSADFADVVKRAYRALCEFKVEGVATNIGLQQSILSHPDFSAHRIDTRFVDERIAELTASANSAHRRLFFDGSAETTARRPAIDPLFEGHALAF
ncbi:MAG: biotin carboxylase N-terminal domain-containing protein, partial [Candidatus Binataceae bacterium]